MEIITERAVMVVHVSVRHFRPHNEGTASNDDGGLGT